MKEGSPKEVELHDLHEEAPEPPELELDDEDALELIEAAHYVLGRVLQVRQPQWLQTDVISLHKRLEQVISFVRVH